MTKLSSKFWMLSILALVGAVAAFAPDVALAADADNVGEGLFGSVQSMIQGNLGVLAGLLISLFGLWMWLVQQSSWGLIIVIAGAALTAFPGIYGSLSEGLQNAFDEVQGDAERAKNPSGGS